MTQINYTYLVIGLFLLLLAGFVVWIILTIGDTGNSDNPSSSIPSNLTVTHTVGPVTKSLDEDIFVKGFSNSFADDSFTIKKSSKSLDNEYNFFDVVPKAAYTSNLTISGQGTINWGDGVTVNVNNKTPTLVTHIYQSEGSYTITIKGKYNVLGLTSNDNPSSNVIGNLTVTDVVCVSGNTFTNFICNSPVQTFTGLTKLNNVTEFQFGNNTIELDFSNYPKLTAVGLSDKGYGGDFDVSTLRTSITSVYLNDNNITSISNVNNLPNLVNLFLNKTSITTVDLSSNKKLQQLGLDSTNITSLSFISTTNNPNITYLDISNCVSITNLTNITQFTGLKTLILDGLTELTGQALLTNLVLLTSLSFNGCSKLENITVNGCTKLVSLDATGCELLTGLSATGCKVLTNVIVKDCYLLADMNFSNCSALTLETINFQTDLLKPPSTTIPLSVLILNNCTSVVKLDLTDCASLSNFDITGCSGISELLLIGCSNLNNSDVGGTIIKTNCLNVTIVKVEGTSVTTLDVSGLQKLIQVVFNGSSALSLDASNCPVLTDVDVNNSENFTTLNASNCPNLIALYIYNCLDIENINISNCPKLTLSTLSFVDLLKLNILNITNCTGITSLNLSGCVKLGEDLTLNNGLIFNGCSNITNLNLNGCVQLDMTSTVINDNCPKVSVLDVTSCKFGDLQTFTMSSNYLTVVTLSATNIINLILNDCPLLTTVMADDCTVLTNLTFNDSDNLTQLSITNCTSITGLDLSNHAKFTNLNITGSIKIADINLEDCDMTQITANAVANQIYAFVSPPVGFKTLKIHTQTNGTIATTSELWTNLIPLGWSFS